MTVYIIQYEEYLRAFQVSDFPDRAQAEASLKKLEGSPNASLSAHVIENDMDCKRFGKRMRRDIYDLVCEEGYEAKPDEEISPERLFMRLEIWMKE